MTKAQSHRLVVIRHAKSDWNVVAADLDRPLAKRGRKQAPAVGKWLAEQGIVADRVVVSVAERARETWRAIADQLGDSAPTATFVEAAYTFDGDHLLEVVRALPDSARVVLLVGHNPAVAELVEALTGEWVPMPTAALAVVDVPTWSDAGPGTGRLVTAGRPADGRGFDRG